MNSPFSRPLFRGNFLQHYAEGGIVSTVAGPEEMPMEQGQDPMQILQGMAQQVETTEQNLDAAGSLDEILSSFTGQPTTAADARNKLAGLVGERDAEKTPDSVLALVQPAMAIMDMSRQMQPEGGIQQAPFNGADGQPMPPQEAEAGMPPANFQQGLPGYAKGGEVIVPGFAPGGEVDMNAIMAKYAALEGQIPQGYASDPTSAWMALAQMGAGIASGPTFAQGMARGTEMAGPYMQAGLENVSRKKSALQAFVANEAQNQEQNNFTAEQNDKQIAAQDRVTRMQIQAQKDTAKLGFDHDWNLRKWDLENPQMGDTQRMTEDLAGLYKTVGTLPDGDPQKDILQKKIDAYENVLFPADKSDPLLKYKLVVKANGGNPEDPAQIGAVIKDEMAGNDNSTSDIKNAKRLSELDVILKADPNDAAAKAEFEFLKKASVDGGVNVNLGEKGTLTAYKDYQDKKEKVYNPSIASRIEQRNNLEIMKAVLAIDPSKGGFETGLLPEQRIMIGQAMEMVGFKGTVPEFLRSPALGQLFQTASEKLNTEQQKDMARGTNLTFQIIQKANANIGKNPDANKLWIDIQSKVLDWYGKNDEYLSMLERTYGTDNPGLLQHIDPENPAVQGMSLPKKPLSKLTEAEIFSPDGKPLLSYDDYVTWRQIHEPAIDASVRDKITGMARAPGAALTIDGKSIPTIGDKLSATPPLTNRQFTAIPGVSVDNAPEDPTLKLSAQIFVKGDPSREAFVYDATTGMYKGAKTGRLIDPRTGDFVTPATGSGR